MPDRWAIRVIRLNAVVAIAYAVTGWLGLRLPFYGEHVTLLWVPTAIALAGIVLAGPTIIPGIFLGSFGLNVALEPALPGPAAVIAIGNTLAPSLTGIVLVRSLAFRPQLDRVRDALAYLGVGVIGTGFITATLGALALCSFGDAPWGEFSRVWPTWFGGEAAGSLLVGPFLLSWLSAPDPIVSRPVGPREKVAMTVSTVVVSAIVLAYGERFASLSYAFGVLFIWILLGTGLRGASLAVVTVAVALVVGTTLGGGPFVGQAPREEMLSLWMFLAAVSSATLIGGGLMAERDHALHHQQRLLAELDHRVKNTLATIVALAERSCDDTDDGEDFRAKFIGKVRAIARTHEGLARSNWEPMTVRDVVAMTLAPFGGAGSDRLLASGDTATLTASEVAPLTMVLHELATNAAKYGAWSRSGGRVAIAWGQSRDDVLRLHWNETGGPALVARPAPGYGLRLIEGIVSHQLGGHAEIEFHEDGLACTFQIPAAIRAGTSSL